MKQKLDFTAIALAVVGMIIVLFVPLFLMEGQAFAAASGTRRSPKTQAANSAQTGQAPSREALAGTWKLNRKQSDDPAQKVVGDDNIQLGDTGTAAPTVGQLGGRADNTPAGVGIGTVGGGMGGGGVQSLPAVPAAHRWETDKDRQKKLEFLMPANSLTIEPKENEFDFVDDQSRKLIFYTDARKLRKSKDAKVQEFDARWDAGHLAYAEKRPPRGTITRTFELSSDGRQMYETTEIDNGSIAAPIVIKYVYDAAPAGAQP